MVTDPVVLLVAALGGAVALVLLDRLVSRRLRGEELWSASVGALLVGGGLLMESQLVGTRAPWQAVLIGLVGLSAVPPLVAARRHGAVREHVAASRLPLLILALSTTALLVNLVRNPLAPSLEVYSRALAPVFWVLVTLVVLLGGLSRAGFVTGALAAFSVLCVLMPVYPDPVGTCPVDKCSVFGSLLQGPYASENFLSVVAGSLFFLSLTLRRDALSLVSAAAAGMTLLAAGGRGSMLAVALGVLVAAVLLFPRSREWVAGWGTTRRRGAALLTTCTFAAVALALIVRSNTSDFSRRGNVWRRGLNAVREEWFLGAGLSRWDGYEGVAAVSHHYPHSQYLLILFSAGLVGLGLYALVMASVLSSALVLATASTSGAWLVGHVAFLLTVGLVEVVFNPLSVDGLSWVLIAHVLPVAGSDQRPTVDELRVPVDDRRALQGVARTEGGR